VIRPSSESRRGTTGPVTRPASDSCREPGPAARPAPDPGGGSGGTAARPAVGSGDPDGLGGSCPPPAPAFDSGGGSCPAPAPAFDRGSGTCPAVPPAANSGRGSPGPVSRPAPGSGRGITAAAARRAPESGRGTAVSVSRLESGPELTGSVTRAKSGRRVQVPGPADRGIATPGTRPGSLFPAMGELVPGIRFGSGLAPAGREAWPPGVGVADAGVAGAGLADTGLVSPEMADPELAGAGLAGAGLAVRSAWPRGVGLANGRTRPFLPMPFYPPGRRADALPPVGHLSTFRGALSAKIWDCYLTLAGAPNMPIAR
jgi:hypothetical protein